MRRKLRRSKCTFDHQMYYLLRSDVVARGGSNRRPIAFQISGRPFPWPPLSLLCWSATSAPLLHRGVPNGTETTTSSATSLRTSTG